MILLALAGCAAQLAASGSTGEARVSARVQADPAVVAAARLAAAGVELVSAHATGGSQVRAGGDVHVAPAEVTVRSTAIAPAVVVRTPSVPAADAAVRAGASGSSMGAGVIGGAGVTAGAGVLGAQAARSTERVSGVVVRRIGTGARGDVVLGGTITVIGVPRTSGLVVLDGDVRVAGGRSAGAAVDVTNAQWTVAGGTVLVGASDGRRWRCRVDAGRVRVRNDGPGADGRTVWATAGGDLYVTVVADGGGDLALDATTGSSAPGAVPSPSRTALGDRALGALDTLLRTASPGSSEALRLASAVQVAIRDAGATPAFYSTPIVGRSVVLVVDVSYSMRDPDPAAVDLSIDPDVRPTKLDVARAELVKVLASLPAGTAVDVVAFSSATAALWDAPRVLDDASLDEAIRWVAALHPVDETHPLEAVRRAQEMRPEQIVLLSDGRPTHADVSDGALLAFADSLGARLDVVGIGPDQDTPFLDALAAHAHGTARHR